MPRISSFLLLSGGLLAGVSACRRPVAVADGPWHLVQRPADDACAYVSAAGDTVIPFGHYPLCFTRRFAHVAIVLKPGLGFVGIDRQERVLFRVHAFDNGPDYPVEGLFRIVGDSGRLGYADTLGRVVIAPRFGAAFPFEHGRARVGRGCQAETDGEHSWWACAEWYYVDRQGRRLEETPPGR
ncbi:WG repeat-containing protein [Hymenobacter sp. 15J16-1T3B]|uniref:WG repeat-containing protein n=1 Tax=Hymenobacter sp. 15J16-1T3B TaxID=2886941 RepID=UPI001D12E9EF|nr:WG repeat-containing protein [Hymenobacter sp. 15J16-1T3B]MCC3156328.1 WG repeat-containing protein [Hymenobacter sp. 15J16-1T3B]